MQAIAHLPGCSSNSSSIRLLRESCGERRLHVVPCCSCVVTRACRQEVCLAKDDSKRRGRGTGRGSGRGSWRGRSISQNKEPTLDETALNSLSPTLQSLQALPQLNRFTSLVPRGLAPGVQCFEQAACHSSNELQTDSLLCLVQPNPQACEDLCSGQRKS